MNNLVEPIKLTKPVEPVQNQSSSVGQHNSQQSENQTQGKDDFQRVLDQQVETRRQQEKQQAQKKEAQSKPTENQSAKTTHKPHTVDKKINITDTAEKLDETDPEVTVAVADNGKDIVKQATPKPAVKQHTPVDKTKPLVADTTKNTKAPVDAKQTSELVDKKPTQPKVEITQTGKEKKLSNALKSNKPSKVKDTIKEEPTVDLAKTDKNKIVEADIKHVKEKKADQTETQHVEEPAEVVSKQANALRHEIADVPVKSGEVIKKADVKTTQQPEKNTTDVKASPKQLSQKEIQHSPQQLQQRQPEAVDVAPVATELVEPEVALAELDANTVPKHSVIAELQKTALEKRELAKHLQQDLNVKSAKSAMLSDTSTELSNELPTEKMSGNRAADFIQTMSQQANAVKQAVQRPVPSDLAKADAIKDTATKPVDNPSTLANVATPAAQAASMSPSAVMSSAPLGSSNQIYAYPGKNGWNQAISQKVMYMVGAGDQTARLNLNPPELGPLQVVIQVNNEKADATFISDNAEVRQALEDGMEYLKEKMDDAGVALGQANVNDGQQFNQQEQREAFQALANSNGNGSANGLTQGKEEQATTSQKVMSNNNGLVDTFA